MGQALYQSVDKKSKIYLPDRLFGRPKVNDKDKSIKKCSKLLTMIQENLRSYLFWHCLHEQISSLTFCFPSEFATFLFFSRCRLKKFRHQRRKKLELSVKHHWSVLLFIRKVHNTARKSSLHAELCKGQLIHFLKANQ